MTNIFWTLQLMSWKDLKYFHKNDRRRGLFKRTCSNCWILGTEQSSPQSQIQQKYDSFIHFPTFFQELLAEEPSVFKSVVQKIKKSSKYEQISLEDTSGEDNVVGKKSNIFRENKATKLIFQHEDLNSTRGPQENRCVVRKSFSINFYFF